jgi:sulfopyruvate decarboxylase TPP-binding subunit
MTTQQAQPVARGVTADAIVSEILKLGVTHIICVPDTFQKSVIGKLQELSKPKFLIVCTEDEAMGINAGLYVGGQKPMLLIQNNGVFASINTIKAIALDAKVPTFMLVGQFQRDVTKPPEENRSRAVRMLEPTLATWGVPYFRLEGPEDIGNIAQAYAKAQETQGPAALIVGAPTV